MPHRTVAELEPHLDHLAASPKDVGELELLVCRPTKGTRRLLEEGCWTPVSGSWATAGARGRTSSRTR
jgi:hypothetical protein